MSSVKSDKECKFVEVISQEMLTDGIYSLKLNVGTMAAAAKPGQFVNVYSNDGARMLPRPISICEIDKEAGVLRLVYRVAGAGTAEFSKLAAGDKVKVMGPLGNGYTMKDGKAILIAGGIGVPPMLQLAKELTCEKTIVLGYRDANLFLKEDFEPYGEIVIATEDGSVGTKGNVIDAIKTAGVTGEVIYSCGPTPMLRALKAYAAAQNIEAQLSLEERMACGIGACLACVCQSTEKDHHSNVNNKRVCADGPVFDSREVEL